jgi:ParG
MTGKKKQVDFSVRPRKEKETLPADPEKWVREGQGAETARGADGGREKRLTLNLPAGLHTAFKGRCVVEGVTIQDKVRVLIERELKAEQPIPENAAKPF